MNDYCIRCAAADVPGLYALAVALGVLAPIEDADTYAIAPPYTGGWDVIGEIHRQTGVSVTTIGRVARYLAVGNGGYALAVRRLQER